MASKTVLSGTTELGKRTMQGHWGVSGRWQANQSVQNTLVTVQGLRLWDAQ
jgi:hypothetical protein